MKACRSSLIYLSLKNTGFLNLRIDTLESYGKDFSSVSFFSIIKCLQCSGMLTRVNISKRLPKRLLLSWLESKGKMRINQSKERKLGSKPVSKFAISTGTKWTTLESINS